jgi:hypothetical protein
MIRKLPEESKGIKDIILCSPVYNCAQAVEDNFPLFVDLETILRRRGCRLHLLMTNDNSTDKTKDVLVSLAKEHKFMHPHHNEKNLRNARNIIAGYTRALDLASELHKYDAISRVLIGSLDADGEHNPLLMMKHIEYMTVGIPAGEIRQKIGSNTFAEQHWAPLLAGRANDEKVKVDGVVGSIIYPDHGISYIEATTMRFFGLWQAAKAGIPEPFYIQSPGWQLHRVQYLREAVINFLPRYKAFFAGRNPGEEFPHWGMHGVIDSLVAVAGGRLWSAFLECYGMAPNRNLEKLNLQRNAAALHDMTMSAFLMMMSAGKA